MFNAGFDLDSGFQLYSFGSYSDRDGEGYNFFRYPVSANNAISVHPQGFLPLGNVDVTVEGQLIARSRHREGFPGMRR